MAVGRQWRCGSGEEEGLAFQYPERITGRALDGWSPWSYMGLEELGNKGRRGEGDEYRSGGMGDEVRDVAF